MTTVSLIKYHALGNDFLVALDAGSIAGSDGEVAKELVRQLCDRRRGVGADGLVIVRPAAGGGAAAMELRNADGGRAETSGNGLRCLALALVDAGAVASRSVRIETDAGDVAAEVGPGLEGGCAEVSVAMGRVRLSGPEAVAALPAGLEAWSADVGNPHLVLLGRPLGTVDIGTVGPELDRAVPGGRNVELAVPDGEGGLDLTVWERGAGLTDACGSGSCAAAAVARFAGLSGDRVAVRNPGGTLAVELAGPLGEPEATLTGPACRIARIVVEVGGEGSS